MDTLRYRRQPTPSRQTVLLTIFLLLAAVLRFVALGRESLWLDEVITVWQVQRPFPGMFRAVAADIHPPLYYLLLHGWLAVWPPSSAGSEALIRLPSALASLLALPLTYLTGRRLGSSSVGLLAMALLAVFPLDVWYAREARMYSLAALWSVAALWAGINVADRGKWRDHLAFALAVLAGMYTHYPFVVLWFAYCALVPLVARQRGRNLEMRRWMLTQTSIVVALLPLVPLVVRQASGPLGHSLWRWAVARLKAVGGVPALLGAALLLGGIIILALLARRSKGLPSNLRSLPWPGIIGVPTILLIGATMWQPVSSLRQFVLFTPPLLLALAWASNRKTRAGGWVQGLLISTLILALLGSGYNLMELRKEAWRDVAALVEREGQVEDGVLVHAGYLHLPFRYYYQGDLPIRWAREGTSPQAIPSLAQGFHRTWLVEGHLKRVDPNREVESWFDQQRRLVKQASFRALIVRLYEMP